MIMSEPLPEKQPGSWGAPEVPLAAFAFLMHFVWEMLQTPLFVGMPTMAHWPATLFCLWATLGDVVIAIAGFEAASLVRRDRGWFLAPARFELAAYYCVGVLATMALEWHAIGWGRWSYAASMPLLPILGTGLAPLLQWILLPGPVLYLLRRHYRGDDAGGDLGGAGVVRFGGNRRAAYGGVKKSASIDGST